MTGFAAGGGGGPTVLDSGTLTATGGQQTSVSLDFRARNLETGSVPVPILSIENADSTGFSSGINNDDTDNSDNPYGLVYELSFNSGFGPELKIDNRDSSDLTVSYQILQFPAP